MGVFLDKPKTEKTTADGSARNLRYGVSAMQGWRTDMEDAHSCETKFKWKDWSFFGVFDGHAGATVSKFCTKHLLECIMEATTKEGGESENPSLESVKIGLRNGFLKLDEKLLEEPKYANGVDKSGTTAVVVLISPTHIIWANCGDSRGLLCRDGKVFYNTEDHKPVNAEEKQRIEKAGGTVMMQRVNGTLAVSRALGDFEYKKISAFPPEAQLVSPEPEVHIIERSEADEFVFLACDGVYDVMTNEEVVKYIHHQLELTDDLVKICSGLIDGCLHKNSKDNMSAVLVTLPAAPAVSVDAIKKEEELQKRVDEAIELELQKLKNDAKETFDLDDHLVMRHLNTEAEMPEGFDVTTKKPSILVRLAELRIEKFGDKMNEIDTTQDMGEPPEAFNTSPPEFAEIKLFTAENLTEVAEAEPIEPDVAVDTSDTPADTKDGMQDADPSGE